ncbi:TIGR04255 family protein [Pirellulales bacterium]|nr:TIGR04255 family protein [Pirellulales bacterium]
MSELSQNKFLSSPDFESPPVVETALSIQFTGIKRWQAIHFGLYFHEIRDRFPEFHQEPPLPPLVETVPPAPREPKIQFKSAPIVGRGLYTAADQNQLIQVQDNRFALNWRQEEECAEYPRFAYNRDVLMAEFKGFATFCSKEGLGTPEPSFVEVLYVNRLQPQDGESIPELIDAVFDGVSANTGHTTLPPLELMTLNRTFVLEDGAGRLYAEIGVGYTKSQESQEILFKLTSRLRHETGDLVDTIQVAHDWLIKGFVSLTREDCRKTRWGQNSD